jgi:murein DD-endopeptidase MepM/ murein hydrolase activator NlpD
MPPKVAPLSEAEADAAEAAFLAYRSPKADPTAIKAYQLRIGVDDDGKPGKLTWAALDALRPDDDGIPEGSFPLARVPDADYTTGMRAFGARRSGGTRAHAGVDLYAKQGTDVFAVADGTVLRVAPFYLGTWAIEVDHGAFIARYCEVSPNVRVKVGEHVQREQHIGDVGHMVGITLPSDMLHFEVYNKTATGSLTQTSPARSARHTNGLLFKRRKDLKNPTPYLNRWRTSLPK